MSTINTKTEDKLSKEVVKNFFGTSHAFIIGINSYSYLPELKTAVNDAEAIAKTLADFHDYEVYPPLINATQAEITKLFTEVIPEKVGDGDRVFLYFAGHGISIEREGKPNEGFLAPVDAIQGDKDSLIHFDELYSTLNALPCKHGLLVMDCCFSGAVKWASHSRDVLFDLPEVIYDKRLVKYAGEEAWQVITSAGADQKAKDFVARDGEDQEGAYHSPFAQALLDALGEDSRADLVPETNDDSSGGDGLISVSELFVYLKSAIGAIEEIKDQTPGYFTLPKHGNGEFFFLHPKHPLTLPRAPERNPFVGLKPYTAKESYLYFGQTAEIESLKDKVESHALVLFTGTSGIGKTSLLYGGLLPALEESEVKNWNILPEIEGEGSPKDHARVAISKIMAKHDNLLILDNYAKLISGLSPDELAEYEQLLTKASDEHPNLKIIASIREEDFVKLDQDILRGIGKRTRHEMPQISVDQVPETIKDICRKIMAQEVLLFKSISQSKEEGKIPAWSKSEASTLLDKIVEDIRYASQVLPLFSLVMEKLYLFYERGDRDDRELSIEDYVALGGAIGILHTHVQQVFEALESRQEKEAMKKLLLRMIAFEEESPKLKKIEAWQLEFSDEIENEIIQKVIAQLLDQRILFSYLDAKKEVYYEIAHPQLLNKLDFLGGWKENTSALALQYELREHVRNIAAPLGHRAFHKEVLKPMMRESIKTEDYSNFLKGRSGAYADFWHKKKEKLDHALSYLISNNHVMSEMEADFVQASKDVRTRNSRILSLFQWGISGVLLGLLIAAIIFAIFARKNQIKAQENQATAERNEKTATERLNAMLYRDFNKIIASGVRYNILSQSRMDFQRAETFWADSIGVDTLFLPQNQYILKVDEMKRIQAEKEKKEAEYRN